jgi:hypothetical protein
MNLIASFLCLSMITLEGQGYARVEMAKTLVANDLAGHILDPAGAPVANAHVELIRCRVPPRLPDQIVARTDTDAEGNFRFARRADKHHFCVLVSKEGFDQLQFTVDIRRSGRPLNLKLPIAA